jgi:NADPH-dependent glutamate synthase beta subunit-like oxidoreductase/Pyruvate/2-oxoacid:ferredoxin oxidoreductase delta subunit/ferredoxin
LRAPFAISANAHAILKGENILENIRLQINGQAVETTKGKSVLQAALAAGIYIPHLCYHPDLSSIGACRLCVVEIEGCADTPTSCTTPAVAGMVVKTKTPKVEQIRRLAMELIMASHPSECTGCPKYMKCELQSLVQYLGISADRLRKRLREIPVNTSNPLILHDFTRCIRCGRCVRACRELRGAEVLNYQKRNGELHIGTDADRSLADAGCRFCGACIEVCPTGALRDQAGIFKEGVSREAALVPCRSACPASVDVPRFIRYIREKNYPAATAVVREKVPFPLILGNICSHKCEGACRRNELNESVSVCRLKRFAAENDDKEWKKNAKQMTATGKRVAVIGAGPAGLTAAYYLSKQGHGVTVLEALPYAGGQCRVGIPEYRLPRDIVEADVKEIENAGVEIKTNTRVDSLDDLFAAGYHAILVAIGTHQGVKLPIPGADLDGVLVNASFLRAVSLGSEVEVGNRVVVIGGGNVAFDCARVARRLGASQVQLACLESKEKMPASLDEIEQGQEEGIIIHPSHSFVKIVGDQGHVTGVECLAVESFELTADRQVQIKVTEGSEHILPADTVIFAVGQRPENVDKFGLAINRGNTLQADPDTLATSREGVFAAGDVVTGTDSVIAAIAAGRKSAIAIDKFLGGDGNIAEQLAPVEKPAAWIGRQENFAYQHRCEGACAAAEERINSFSGVDHGYAETAALKEAERCCQCDLRLNVTVPKFWSEYSSRK